MASPSEASNANPPEPKAETASRSSFELDCARLKLLLADQLSRHALREARDTVTAVLCLNPVDTEALSARDILDEQLKVTTPHPVGEVRRFEGHKSWVNSVVFSQDGTQALTGGGADTRVVGARPGLDRSTRMWDVNTGSELHRYLGRLGMVTGLVFLGDGKRAISSSLGSGLNMWDLETGDTIRRFDPNVSQVCCVAIAPDNKLAVSGSEDKLIHIWKVETGTCLVRCTGHTSQVRSVAVSPDGKRFLSGSDDGTVRLWSTETGKMVRRMDGHTDKVQGVAFSTDGEFALSASADGTIGVWNVETGAAVHCFTGHKGPVNCVAASASVKRFVSGGADGTVRVWDIGTKRELKSFEGHKDQVMGVACSPDGNYALSGGRDATVRLWQLPAADVSSFTTEVTDLLNENPFPSTAALIELICRARILTADEQAELTSTLRLRFPSIKAIVLHLLERGWLTNFQLLKLATGEGTELRLGDWVLRESLGEGGMGQVFRARKPGTTDDVALKIVLPELTADVEAIKQFRWEIKALSEMSHPNIIKTYDAGQEGDRHYFTMEYVEGIDLFRLVKQFGPLPVVQACHYIRQAALGLEHAHEHCLIHRDIKPANLLLTFPKSSGAAETASDRTSQGAVIKVLDWGLAGLRLPAGRQRQISQLPREENVGTADYISPEQAQNSMTADIRTDIYSLGCTFYHLLTGQPPFSGKSIVQKLMKHQKEEAVPVRTHRPDVPEGVAAIIQRMMAKDPKSRYPTPAFVALALAPHCRD